MTQVTPCFMLGAVVYIPSDIRLSRCHPPDCGHPGRCRIIPRRCGGGRRCAPSWASWTLPRRTTGWASDLECKTHAAGVMLHAHCCMPRGRSWGRFLYTLCQPKPMLCFHSPHGVAVVSGCWCGNPIISVYTCPAGHLRSCAGICRRVAEVDPSLAADVDRELARMRQKDAAAERRQKKQWKGAFNR